VEALLTARYVVIGTSGAGKSTFARRLATAVGSRYIELDDLYWDANWTPRTAAEFEARVVAQTAAEHWVLDGNYTVIRDIVWPRATDIVWLNFGRAVVLSRVLRRTLGRIAFREELWSGNRESLRRSFLSRESILLWSFNTFGKNRRKYAVIRANGEHPHLRWHELRSPRDAHRFLREVRSAS
jgi:adenylate kinase family enzyme